MTGQQKLLLLFIGAENREIDPIRIMKGQFILSKETPGSWLSPDMRYHFVPYSFGPCSFEIYSDLDSLERQNLIRGTQPPQQSWKNYAVSNDPGNRELESVRNEFRPELLKYVLEVRRFVDSLNFRALLTAVYKKYPDYAVNSVFRF